MPEMDLGARTGFRLRRWRRLNRVVSGALGAAALAGAVHLGATGPLVSPVQPPTAVVAAAPEPLSNDADDRGLRRDAGDRGGRGGGFGLGRRR